MDKESSQDKLKNLDAALESMSKEEIALALTESIQRTEEITSSSKLLLTHLKVLCYKNGGTLTYTKEEFDAAAKEDSAFDMEYRMEDGKEVCVLRLLPREKKAETTVS